MTRITQPLMGTTTWIANAPGPITQEALDAIGRPYEGGAIQIDVVGERITLNGEPVSGVDAELVRIAWHCDPRMIGPEAPERIVNATREAIASRKALSERVRLLGLGLRRAPASVIGDFLACKLAKPWEG